MSGVAVVGQQRLSDLAGPRGGGGDSRVLKHSDGAWTRAAGGAEAMRTHLAPVRAELGAAHEGLPAGAGDLAALAELGAVRESWERRITTAQGECASLAGRLRAVARAQGETDEAVRSSFTPAAGGGGAR
ncbi:hypothetical protein [Streptomyces fulvorobeus]|uniref:Uncharacterized protein n=1 Tax=Streptomyces fulvorobeus TaxID=284028 RepID=A0A7J0C7M9_9ACTN|nr:hypothetical protein [Streptomyces fulvorobeus]NYE42085.1 hypothetical protein [Streptomyces fulvorobeus]GFM98461.1 hypothetical protein Sfulv_32720 [Streptomyces fulvorobeus]